MSASLEPEEVGRAVVEETRRVIDYHNARVYLFEAPDMLVPVAFEGRVGAYERVDMAILRTRLGEGFTGWVAQHQTPLRVDDANADPRGSTIPGTDEVDESMLVVPMLHDDSLVGVVTLSKLGLRQFDEEDMRLLLILADQAATAFTRCREPRGVPPPRRGPAPAAGHEQRALALPRPGRRRGPDGPAPRPGRRRRPGPDQHLGRRRARPRPVARLLPGGHPRDHGRVVRPRARTRSPGASSRSRSSPRSTSTDPAADPAEVGYLRAGGYGGLIMLPLVAKDRGIGLVELTFDGRPTDDVSLITLARTMTHEAAMALDNARLYEDARRLADRDPLTGFFNHRYLHERLAEEVVRAARTRRPVSVVMLDLDDFKLVNDSLGHLYGDRVLVHVAECIRSAIRASDVTARYGGDEFALILPDTDHDGAAHIAERILDAFRRSPFAADGRHPFPIGGSVGIATHPVDGRSATDLIAIADQGLYEAKRGGGNRVAADRRAATRGAPLVPAGAFTGADNAGSLVVAEVRSGEG